MTKFFEDYGVFIQIGGPIFIMMIVGVWALIISRLKIKFWWTLRRRFHKPVYDEAGYCIKCD